MIRRNLRIVFTCFLVFIAFVSNAGEIGDKDEKLNRVEYKTFCFVRSVQSSLLLAYTKEKRQLFHLNDYGRIERSEHYNLLRLYLYQGQEYDKNLNLYFYPSRVYSATDFRFFTPDPKSQYYSPYLFVGSDPVNYIDRDGKVGKPLLLYEEKNGRPYRSGRIIDDAHYYPISDLQQGKIPKLENWDGNVYVYAHMGTTPGNEIMMEEGLGKNLKMQYVEDLRGVHVKRLRTPMNRGAYGDIEHLVPEYQVELDAEVFGEKLRELSESQGVKINNVVMGGCEGEVAAERASNGFSDATHLNRGLFTGETVDFFGPRRGFGVNHLIKPLGMSHTSLGFTPRKIHAIRNNHRAELSVKGQKVRVRAWDTGQGKLVPTAIDPTEATVQDLLFHGRMSVGTKLHMGAFFGEY